MTLTTTIDRLFAQYNRPDSPEARLRLDGGEVSLLLSIYPQTLERQHRRNPHTGQVAGRARADAVAALLGQT